MTHEVTSCIVGPPSLLLCPLRQAALEGLTRITSLVVLHISGPLIHTPQLAQAVSSWGPPGLPSLRDLALELDEATQSTPELLMYGSLMCVNPTNEIMLHDFFHQP